MPGCDFLVTDIHPPLTLVATDLLGQVVLLVLDQDWLAQELEE